MLLNDVLSALDYVVLMRNKGSNRIGCPFIKKYGGIECLNHFPDKLDCIKLCGEIFPSTKARQDGMWCPCHILNKKYVKKKFWRKLREARKGK